MGTHPFWPPLFWALYSSLRANDASLDHMAPINLKEYVDRKYGIETDGSLDPESWAEQVMERREEKLLSRRN